MKTYLVTGGAGFIGSHLCDALVGKAQVYVLDNLSTGSKKNLPAGVNLIEGDIRDYKLVEELLGEVDGCFHLAAMVSVPLCNEDILAAHEINLTGTLNIIESAYRWSKKSKKVPVVFTSSCAVYGDNQQLPNTEKTPTIPISIYANTKLSGEYYGRFINEIGQTPFTALRLFNVYGARQKLDSSYSGVISIFLNALIHDEPCIFYGDGHQSRDFVYVKDVVQFFIHAMETSTDKTRIYNVCTGRTTSVKGIAEYLSELLEKRLVIDHKPPKIGDILHSVGCPELAKQELDMIAKMHIKDGLRELISELYPKFSD